MKSFSWITAVLIGLVLATGTGEVIVEPADIAKEPVDAIKAVPIYGEAFYEPEKFRRAHVLMVGLEASTTFSGQLRKPEAYFEIETYGDDTGSNEDFSIGRFTSKKPFDYLGGDPNIYTFDYKEVVVFKTSGTSGIKLSLKDTEEDTDDLLFELDLSMDELPAVGAGYTEYRRKSTGDSSCLFSDNAELVFKVKIVEQTEQSVPLEEIYAITYNISSSKYTGIEYDEVEVILNDETHDYQDGNDKAVIQTWRHADGTQVQGAVLWVLGRGDAFQHPHIVERLFFGPDSAFKYDLYVVNWRLNGLNLHRGFLTDAYYVAQNAYSDYNIYNEEIEAAMDLMKPSGGGSYNKVIGLGSSTGAPILLNYIIENGDDVFDGFIFNSPFLGFGTSCVDEFNARYTTSLLDAIGVWDNDSTVAQVPTVTTDPPIEYQKRNIVMDERRFSRTSLHPHPWSWRPRFSYPSTKGFLKGSADVWTKIEKSCPVTDKPALVLSSKADLVLDQEEIAERSQWISDSRELVTLAYNNHDTFVAYDFDEVLEVVAIVRDWMRKSF